MSSLPVVDDGACFTAMLCVTTCCGWRALVSQTAPASIYHNRTMLAQHAPWQTTMARVLAILYEPDTAALVEQLLAWGSIVPSTFRDRAPVITNIPQPSDKPQQRLAAAHELFVSKALVRGGNKCIPSRACCQGHHTPCPQECIPFRSSHAMRSQPDPAPSSDGAARCA